jgi:hypothetical protein
MIRRNKMETNKHIQLLQRVYAGVLADAVLQLGKEGMLEKVTERKRDEQMKTGKQKATQFQFANPESVFTHLSELFGCADWEITPRESGFMADNKRCMLCEFSKKMGSHSPCNLYCLDPMEGMIKGITSGSEFNVHSTLWDSSSCAVEVTLI